MAITDEDRDHLFNTLRETLGAKDAARMMELLPPLGWSDVDRRFDEIDRRFGELPQIFVTKDDLRAQTNRYIGWMVVTNATLVAAVSLIVSLQ
jgi:hypothetical protein